MIFTKITNCNLQKAQGYLHKGKLNNSYNSIRVWLTEIDEN